MSDMTRKAAPQRRRFLKSAAATTVATGAMAAPMVARAQGTRLKRRSTILFLSTN